MNCSVCRVSTMKDILNDYVERVMLRGFVTVKNVPCKKCKNCGHIEYTIPVRQKLEDLIEEVEEKAEKIFGEEDFWEWTIEFE